MLLRERIFHTFGLIHGVARNQVEEHFAIASKGKVETRSHAAAMKSRVFIRD